MEATKALLQLLKEKSTLKQDLAEYSEGVFDRFKKVVKAELSVLREQISDSRIRLKFENKGQNEFLVFIGSDTLVFQLHTNVFRLPNDNPLWKTDYMVADDRNGYFAMINVYNFLAESVERNRLGDSGYLIGRVFLNFDEHFMVEGKGQLGFLFRDIANATIKDEDIKKIIQASMVHALEFDLITPPYELVKEVNLMQINSISSELKIATGKRLGFKFSANDSEFF